VTEPVTQDASQGGIETLPGSWAPPGARPIELVFRTIGERTSELALELALKHVKPNRAHVMRDVKPWAVAVQRMLQIDHQCSHVVYVDADCLILEDMRPFLDTNEMPHVDCYVRDRFRGRVHCGVHITRIDLIRTMRVFPEPIDNVKYVLSPEGYLRGRACAKLGFKKRLKNVHILHDHFQHYTDIFVKYARRELRSRRQPRFRDDLDAWMSTWDQSGDCTVAHRAVEHAVSAVLPGASSTEVAQYLHSLPRVAEREVRRLGLSQRGQLTLDEVEDAIGRDPVNLGPTLRDFKVFGIGLSRTGTLSLTEALQVIGFDAQHYPTDRATLDTLVRGDARFPLLQHYSGITDITVAPYYADLDRAWPGSKFVLTVRDEESWLRSCRDHWERAPAYRVGEDENEESRVYMEIKRFLRAAVYASQEFDEERLRRVYRHHVQGVTRYFEGRPRDLLVLDIAAGEGYERLAPFLGMPQPPQPFPHRGNSLTRGGSRLRPTAGTPGSLPRSGSP